MPFREAKDRAVAQWETWFLTRLMERHEGNLSEAARSMKMNRSYLRTLLKKRGLR